MMEKILIVFLSLIFLGTFIARNVIVKSKTKQRIRASDPVLYASIVVTNLCIFITIISTFSDRLYQHLGVIPNLRSGVVSTIGYFMFALSILLGWLFSAQLRESWRVGVHESQKTKLIQKGIYKYMRNPYFLSYLVMFIGLFLVRPSAVMLVLIVINSAVFHWLVLKEETHLLSLHGILYAQYKKATGRYIPRLIKKD